MQSLGQLIGCQLRQQLLHSPAVAAAAAAAASSGGLWSSIRWFSTAGAEDSKRLYVGNLSFQTKAEDLARHFGQFGKVQDCIIPIDRLGRSKGFAFVQLDVASADAAASNLNDTDFEGRTIRVSDAQQPSSRDSSSPRGGGGGGSSRGPEHVTPPVREGCKRLYVGNLSFDTKAEELGKHFMRFGAVQDCVIPLDRMGRSKGFAFVELDAAGADAAMAELNQSELHGRPLRVKEADQPGAQQRRPSRSWDRRDY